MKCTWHDKTECQEEAIEKWTEIPFVDIYCGPFYASAEEEPAPRVDHVCAKHIQITRDIWLDACKTDPTKLEFYLNRAYKIERL